MFAIEQILSGTKKEYAAKGELLEIVNTDHAPVLICKNIKGNLIPVHENMLSEKIPGEVEELKPVIKEVRQSRKKLTPEELYQLQYLKDHENNRNAI